MIRDEANHEPYRAFAETVVEIQDRNTKLTGQARAARILLEQSGMQQEAIRASVEGSSHEKRTRDRRHILERLDRTLVRRSLPGREGAATGSRPVEY